MTGELTETVTRRGAASYTGAALTTLAGELGADVSVERSTIGLVDTEAVASTQAAMWRAAQSRFFLNGAQW